MASPSISSDSVVSDEELVRDAALCLRSFYGLKDVIPYSKFCERFKKNFGYSIKDQLKKSDNTFADVMEKVSATTRTKCGYNADQKMITLISGRTQQNVSQLVFPVPVTVPVIQSTQLFAQLPCFEPHAPVFVPQSQMFTYSKAPITTSTEMRIFAGTPNTCPQINPFISSVTDHSTPVTDNRLSKDGSCFEIIEEDSSTNKAFQSLTAIPWSILDMSEPPFNDDIISDENYNMNGTSQSLAAIPWSTCDSLEPQCEKNFEQEAAYESISADNYGSEMDKPVLLSETQDDNMNDSRQDSKGLSVDVTYVPWSSGDEPGQLLTMEHFGGSEDSFYYDAEEELDQGNSSFRLDDHEIPWSQYELNRTVENDEYICSQASASATEEPATKAFSSAYTFRRGGANRSGLVNDRGLDKRLTESLRKLSTLCTLNSYKLDSQEYVQENTAQQKGDTKQQMQDFSSARKNCETISTLCETSRGDHAVMDVPRTSRQEQDVKGFMQRMVQTISIRENIPDDEVDDRTLRKDAKEECCRMWGNEVDNLGELLCFLKLIHKKDGPLLIDECEQRIEAYARTKCAVGDLSWSKFGQNMNVKRMFELRMFRSLGPSNRNKVQPVDCILNARFRILPNGLLSEVYNILSDVKLSKLEVIAQDSKLCFSKTAEEARKEELREILQSEPDVFLLRDDYIMLADSEECFVITGVSEN